MASQKIDDYVGSWSSGVIASHGDQDLLLISLPSRLYALDPLNGNEVWSCEGLGKLVYTSPLVSPQAIVAMSGYQGPAIAVKPGGKGDVTATHRLWIQDQKPPQRVGSGIIVDDYVYVLNAPGDRLVPGTADRRNLVETPVERYVLLEFHVLCGWTYLYQRYEGHHLRAGTGR